MSLQPPCWMCSCALLPATALPGSRVAARAAHWPLLLLLSSELLPFCWWSASQLSGALHHRELGARCSCQRSCVCSTQFRTDAVSSSPSQPELVPAQSTSGVPPGVKLFAVHACWEQSAGCRRTGSNGRRPGKVATADAAEIGASVPDSPLCSAPRASELGAGGAQVCAGLCCMAVCVRLD